MRGRKPEPVRIGRADIPILERLARSAVAPWYQVRRARIVLAIAAGARTEEVAWQMQCDVATVRRTCRRYTRDGLAELLALSSPPRSGSPARLSPPPAGRDREAGVPGARGRGAAPHPLVERRPRPRGGPRGDR